jgi:hypothetical protein
MRNSNYQRRRYDATPKQITGLQLALERRTKKQKAVLARAIENGETELTDLTQVQIARLCGISAPYINQVRPRNDIPSVIQLAAE